MEDQMSTSAHSSAFPKTQWTVIIDAVSANPQRAREALERLCCLYRRPIVNWFRRNDVYRDPEDLAHSFVAYLLEKSLLAKVAPRTGRFRCFLATCMRHFLHDNWDKDNAQKAGGGTAKVPLADNDVEIEAQVIADTQLDVDFALAIHREVMNRLSPREELKPYIFKKDSNESWNDIATHLNATSMTIRKEVSRLRRRHWECFRDVVAQIVDPADKAEETRYLYELLFRNLPLN